MLAPNMRASPNPERVAARNEECAGMTIARKVGVRGGGVRVDWVVLVERIASREEKRACVC